MAVDVSDERSKVFTSKFLMIKVRSIIKLLKTEVSWLKGEEPGMQLWLEMAGFFIHMFEYGLEGFEALIENVYLQFDEKKLRKLLLRMRKLIDELKEVFSE